MQLFRSQVISVLSGIFLFCSILLGGHSQSSVTPAEAALPAGPPPLETGVSATLAGQRGALLHDIRYDLQFHIPAQWDAPIDAEETLSFTMGDAPVTSLVLDFKNKTSPGQLQVNGTEVPVVHRQEHLLIPSELLHPGSNTIHILFTAGNS